MKPLLAVCLLLSLALAAVAIPIGQDQPDYAAKKAAYLDAVSAIEAGQHLTPTQIALLKEFEYRGPSSSGYVIDEAGGPDDDGYLYVDSQEPNGPTYFWQDISTTGTEVSADLNDDNYVGPFDIGFNFNFYDQTYSQFYIQSNGLINFTDEYITLSNYQLPNADFPALIAWYWDDLDPDNPDWNDDIGGYTYYETVTINDQQALIVQCDDWEEFPQGPDVPQIDAQIILFENGDVQINYASVDAGFDVNGGTIGIQNQDGSTGLEVQYNGSVPNYPFGELALLFTRGEPDANVSGVITDSGTNLPISGAEVAIGVGTDITDAGGNYSIQGTYSGPGISTVVSAPGYYSFEGTIQLDPGENDYDFSLDALPPPQDDDYFNDFEDGQGFFSADGLFDHATITIEPSAPYSGTMAWDLAPNADYANMMDEWLISDASWLIGEGTPSISYWHWFSFEPNFDGYNFKVSTDGGESWEVITPNEGYTDDDGVWGNENTEPVFTNNADRHEVWEQLTFDLSAYIGEQVWFAWNAVSDGSVIYPGVCIDDVQILAGDNGPGVDLELTGVETIIPPSGGTLVYDVSLVSELSMTVPGLIFWTTATLPNGASTQPLLQVPFTHTPFMSVFVTGMQQPIPAFAPGGQYVYNGMVGFNTSTPLLHDSFGFEKIGTVAAEPGTGEWPMGDASAFAAALEPDAAEAVTLPDAYELSAVYPNPFNPTATVTVALPDAAELTVGVYNVMGQQVAELAAGSFSAGHHSFVIDGSGLASGIYFVQAHVPGEMNVVQKITLMK